MMICIILYQMSFSTYAFWISFTTTSTYQIKFSANISAKIAIFSTKSSRINGSFRAYKYPSNYATILLTFSWLQIKYSKSKARRLMEMSLSSKFGNIFSKCIDKLCLMARRHIASNPK